MLSDTDTDLFHNQQSTDKYWICETYVSVCVYIHTYVRLYVGR